MGDLDFEGLNARLLDDSHALLQELLPGGNFSGHEYVCGGMTGGKGRSFSVNVNTGKWAEFNGMGGKGGDLISLWASVRSLGQGEAFKELAARTSFTPGVFMADPARPEPASKPQVIVKPPADAPPPVTKGTSFAWCYRDSDGLPIFWVLRWDKEGEDGETTKDVRPMSWDSSSASWVWKGFPDPRPLYGLELLAQRSQAAVMIVEGEKACDAARDIVGDRYVVVTWPNGAVAENKANWAPLHGRKVLIWGDADKKVYPDMLPDKTEHPRAGKLVDPDDQPGRRCALAIAKLLAPHCPEVKILDPGLDMQRKDGWDAADAWETGWNWDKLKEFAGPRIKLFTLPSAAETTIMAPAPRPVPAPAPVQVIPAEPAPAAAVVEAAAVAVDGKKAVGARASAVVHIDDGEAVGQRETFSKVWVDLGLAATKAGAVANVDNVLRVLENRTEFKNLVWFDEFHNKVFTQMDFQTWDELDKPRAWRPVDSLYLLSFMQRHLGMTKITEGMVNQAISVHAHSHVRNEPQDWMKKLEWDKVPRVDGFFAACFGADVNEYTGAVSKNFWIAMVARIMEPGCQVDNMVILEGGQGAFKSSALRLLGGKWSMEAQGTIFGKEFPISLQGRSLVIINEWDKFKKTDVALLKDIISTPVDSYRPLYEQQNADHGRTCIFIATTNKNEYLTDPTGARRYWPLRTGPINKILIAQIREQCYAEALFRYRSGESWWEMPASAKAEQDERRVADEWEELVAEYTGAMTEVTALDIAENKLKIPYQNINGETKRRIGDCLRVLGWYSHTARLEDGRSHRVFRKREVPS